jgi:hypothetical protein
MWKRYEEQGSECLRWEFCWLEPHALPWRWGKRA